MMARSTGPILLAGGITFANQAVINGQAPDWKIPIAAGLGALVLAGLEKVWGDGAVALAWMAVFSVLFVPVNKKASPIQNTLDFLKKNGLVSGT